jgi:hypothetical protein
VKCIGVTILFLNLFALNNTLFAQLSPGDLAKVHEHLEGNLNCTQCHILGEKVSDDKCLSCHKELKVRVEQQKGFHATKEVKSKSCASCHNDHHGKNFQIVKFDEKTFDHLKTGYELTGKHAKIECKECHKPANIKDEQIRVKKYTFLGLDQKCSACHEDYHQNTLSKTCSNCHSTETFKPAPKFKHEKTKFPLAGKHATVDCKECHKIEVKDGKNFQHFSGITFTSCVNCHTDAHKRELGNKCNECHTEESFKTFIGYNHFNHAKTSFPLKGLHKKLDCAKCHNLNLNSLVVLQDRKGIKTEDCISCHKDVHEGKFGTDCKQCHNEDGFRKLSNPDKFDHNLTHYKLEGKHEKVDCKSCHKQKFTDPIEYNACASCHTDYHKGELNIASRTRDCSECHIVFGFTESTYSIDDHSKSSFKLEGAHQATPCLSCHKKESNWKFRNIGMQCIDCHTDIHKGYIKDKFYPNQSCTACHSTESWNDIHFDHTLTGYTLSGQHAKQNCMKCHGLKPGESGNKFLKFSTINATCTGCHVNVHQDQFAKNGETHCESCHDFVSWKPVNFNHDNTAFKLEGKHKDVACSACHKQIKVNDQIIIQYKFENFECVVCHRSY